jgi:hypothetical protein
MCCSRSSKTPDSEEHDVSWCETGEINSAALFRHFENMIMVDGMESWTLSSPLLPKNQIEQEDGGARAVERYKSSIKSRNVL